MTAFVRRLAVCFALTIGIGGLSAVQANAATITVSGFANCLGMLGYPTVEPATHVQIKTSTANVTVGVNLVGFYSANVPNVPSSGSNATAYVSCLSGAGPWNLPFHIPPSGSLSLDLTQPTPVHFAVYLDDPTNLSPINLHPKHPSRPFTVQVFNQNNVLVATRTVTATQFFANGAPTDEYTATIYLGHVSGVRYFKVWLDYTLHHQMQSFINIPSVPGPWNYSLDMRNDSTQTLIVGDVNQDNVVNITDYNLMMQCYSDLLPPKGPCSPSLKRASDLDDDGYVNGTDYNLMVRILNYHGGA